MSGKIAMEQKPNNSTEAPASSTVTIKTPGGFEVLLTSRDFEDKDLTRKQLAHLLNLDKALIASGFSPVVRGFGKQQKPVEYVEGRTCPIDGARLIKAKKKDGSDYIRCENNKFINGQQSGCKYVDWLQPKSGYSHEPYDY